MSEKMCRLTEALCRNLLTSLLDQTPRAENNYCGASFYGAWFHSPLAYNDYTYMVRAAPPPPVRAPADVKPSVVTTHQRPRAEEDNGTRKRLKIMSFDEVVKNNQPLNTLIDIVKPGKETTAAVTTTAYDGRTRIGVDTLSNVYGTEQRIAVATLKDSMERRFTGSQQQQSQNSGVVAKIAQTLLVLALEPIDVSMELVLQHRFDNNVVVENLLHVLAQQAGTTPALFDEDEDAEEHGERVRDFRRQFKKMTINLFSRFPELAIECNETSAVSMLRSVSSLWVCCNTLFEECRALPQSETARSMRAPYRAVFDRVLADRSRLLHATIVTNIEGIGPRHWHQFRQLFVAALMRAHLHVASLRAQQPDNPTLERAAHSLFTTYQSIRDYMHSSITAPSLVPPAIDAF